MCKNPPKSLPSELLDIKEVPFFCQPMWLNTGELDVHMTKSGREKEPAPPVRDSRHSTAQLSAPSMLTDTVHLGKEPYSLPHSLLSLPFSLYSLSVFLLSLPFTWRLHPVVIPFPASSSSSSSHTHTYLHTDTHRKANAGLHHNNHLASFQHLQ